MVVTLSLELVIVIMMTNLTICPQFVLLFLMFMNKWTFNKKKTTTKNISNIEEELKC